MSVRFKLLTAEKIGLWILTQGGTYQVPPTLKQDELHGGRQEVLSQGGVQGQVE